MNELTRQAAAPYHDSVQRELTRLLSWQDRERSSKTYGCFDRTFWGWKFTDFPGARFQEGCYAIAAVARHNTAGNPFAGQERLDIWARAGLRYWQSIQYRDGSFDEAYPWEHSLAATAFTGFYLGEAYLLLKDSLPAAEAASLRSTFAKAGDWLCRNDEHHGVLSNHLAAAAAALEVIARVCEEERYSARSRYFLQRIYDHQSDEGWYREYSGADPGYQTHGTFYMARIWQLTQDAELLESLRLSISFLRWFIHPNGTLGGEYGSRNTEFFFPAGFEILAPALPQAAEIAQFMRPAVARQAPAGLAAMDVYNFLPMLNNYIFAANNAECLPKPTSQLPCQTTASIDFPKAGMVVRSNPNYYCVVGLSKGGVIRAFDRVDGRLKFCDSGYWGRLDDGRVVATQRDCSPEQYSVVGDELHVEECFARINQMVQSASLFLGFRVFTTTLGRIPGVARWIKNLLVHMLVNRKRPVSLRFRRSIRFSCDELTVSDVIENPQQTRLQSLFRENKFAAIHMGSSRYFTEQELDPDYDGDPDLSQQVTDIGIVRQDRTVRFGAVKEQAA